MEKQEGLTARNIKAVVFDVDGTLLQSISWNILNRRLGVTLHEDRQLQVGFMSKKFDYQGWCDRLVAIYKKRNRQVTRRNMETILEKCVLAKGAQDVCLELHKRGYQIGIVSGGLDPVVRAVARKIEVPAEYVISNSFAEYDQRGYLERIVAREGLNETKINGLRKLCELWELDERECLYVGDSFADKVLFDITGNGVTFTHNRCSALHNHCWQKINQLEDLLTFL
jgi:phosphoserine phosphatase